MTDVSATSAPLPISQQPDEPRVQQPAESQEMPKREYNNREEIIARLQIVVGESPEEAKEEVELLKQLYYKLRKSEVEAARAAFVADGGDEAAFVAEPDTLEAPLKTLLNDFKAKKAAALEARELRRRENLAIKQGLLEEIRKIADDTDNINKYYNEFHDLSKRFREINDIPPAYVNDLWKDFQKYTEKFYDQLKINKELRDYDFKKNQERKEELCAEAEALADEADVVGAFRRLQELHEEWRQTGPVAPQVRESLWSRFKEASTVINKKHQGFYENIKEAEAENERLKDEICQKIEAIDLDALKTFQAWDNKTKEVIAMQEEWRKIGLASKRANAQLFERFRKMCDNFFARKAAYFAVMKDELAANLERKRELCEKAEALKDSTDWRHTTDLFVALQKEWKTVGPVARKYSDALWTRFIAACDYFFAQKEKNFVDTRSVESVNLAAKRELIAKLKELQESADAKLKDVQEVMAKWKEIGHVPFKEKDKVFKEYQGLLDVLFKRFNKQGRKARLDSFASSVGKNENSLLRDRERLMRQFEHLKNELKNYENNIGFLSASSKGGNALVKDMERKMAKLKEEMELLAKKIDIIDEKMK
jgi:hypothetical protein